LTLTLTISLTHRQLGLTTLETRRVRGDMSQVYRMMTGKDKIDREQFFFNWQTVTMDYEATA